jgi:hypothetical protein
VRLSLAMLELCTCVAAVGPFLSIDSLDHSCRLNQAAGSPECQPPVADAVPPAQLCGLRAHRRIWRSAPRQLRMFALRSVHSAAEGCGPPATRPTQAGHGENGCCTAPSTGELTLICVCRRVSSLAKCYGSRALRRGRGKGKAGSDTGTSLTRRTTSAFWCPDPRVLLRNLQSARSKQALTGN